VKRIVIFAPIAILARQRQTKQHARAIFNQVGNERLSTVAARERERLAMKMLFVADLHYALKQFDWLVANADKFDLVIIGGDLLDLASSLDFDVQIVVVEKYLARIRQKSRLLVSSGNHDGDSRNEADESVAEWIHGSEAEGLSGDGDSLELPGALLTVCPWWDGPASRAQVEAQLQKDSLRVRGRWIWVHHAPPSGSPLCWTGKQFAGDNFLREWIERFKPDIVFSGHIHNAPFYAQGAWVDQIGKTWAFNPGRQIGSCPAYITLDLETMTAEWISLEGELIRQLTVANG
jgi:Icc-related predicted phosphoesterase